MLHYSLGQGVTLHEAHADGEVLGLGSRTVTFLFIFRCVISFVKLYMFIVFLRLVSSCLFCLLLSSLFGLFWVPGLGTQPLGAVDPAPIYIHIYIYI